MTLTGVEEEWSELGRSLLERKHLSADWLPAFAALPRSDFLPDVIWPFDMGTGTTVAVGRHGEPGREEAQLLLIRRLVCGSGYEWSAES